MRSRLRMRSRLFWEEVEKGKLSLMPEVEGHALTIRTWGRTIPLLAWSGLVWSG
jgi:hypothetical protein